jgi:two-component system, NarL family, response regulator DegU
MNSAREEFSCGKLTRQRTNWVARTAGFAFCKTTVIANCEKHNFKTLIINVLGIQCAIGIVEAVYGSRVMSTLAKVNVLLVDGHPLVRDGIRSSLFHHPTIGIVGEAATGRDGVKRCKELKPDVVLLELNTPEMDGLQAVALIRKASPETKIIVLTVNDGKEYVLQALRCGLRGYILKDAPPEELAQAILAVAGGQAFFSPRISRVLLEGYVNGSERKATGVNGEATKRETEVLRWVARGKTSKEIASQLKLSARTVETYRVRLKRKLNARNVAELLGRAREEGLI